MMKTALKLLAVALLALTSFQSNAYDFEADGLRYQILSEEDRTVEVSAGSSSPFFIIPAEVISDSKTYTVTAIANRAFCGLPMRSVTMPNTVTSIGIAAFLNCPDLGYVNIPKSVTSIGDNAFRGCESLQGLDVDSENSYFAAVDGILYDKSVSTLLQCPAGKSSVIIPNSVTSIKGSAFADCYRLTSVTISGSVASIGNYAFSGCKNLESINVDSGNSVYSSVDGILYDKSVSTLLLCPAGKSSVTIPETVTSIEKNAFLYCINITAITIPGSVTSIGDSAFSGCTALENINVDSENQVYSSVDGILYDKSVSTLLFCPVGKISATIPNTVTSIAPGAFSNCKLLSSLNIPDSVESIGESAFYNCTGLTSLTIPDSVTSIERSAFRRCSALTSLIIPDSVTSIGGNAFEHCTGLTSLIIPNSVTFIGDGAFMYCTGLTSLIIPNSVTSIEGFTFAYCSGLKSLTIPNSVTYIGTGAFHYCTALESIYMQCEVPVKCAPSFSDENFEAAVLYVPTGTLSAYKEVEPWKNFRNIKEMDFSGVDGIEAGGKLQISVENGCITVGGNYESVTVYNMQGRVVYSGSSQVIDNLAPGIYIVRAGSQTAKVSI